MKLNPECVRDILLTIENYPVPMNLDFYEFSSLLPQYSKDEILYCCKRLHEANYLNLNYITVIKNSKPELDTIGDLTFFGHEFLENIKDDTNWKLVKSKAIQVGSFALPILQQIASSLILNKIKQ